MYHPPPKVPVKSILPPFSKGLTHGSLPSSSILIVPSSSVGACSIPIVTQLSNPRDGKKLIKAGKNFFKKRFKENRSNNLIDNYEFSQNQSLPKNFDNSKLNISFFNTALWEFQSIVENEKYYLFKNDFEFLKFLNFKFKKEKDINFYFRCHPNMVNEKNYLKKISVILKNFNNLKFIHPESEISTKELIKNSDLIINFGSSVSIEGGYYGKKIITLAPSIFLYFSF
mgnify:CR=1 FL=1